MHTTTYLDNVPQSIREWCAAHPGRTEMVAFDVNASTDDNEFPLLAFMRRGWMFDGLVSEFSADTDDELIDEFAQLRQVHVIYPPTAK